MASITLSRPGIVCNIRSSLNCLCILKHNVRVKDSCSITIRRLRLIALIISINDQGKVYAVCMARQWIAWVWYQETRINLSSDINLRQREDLCCLYGNTMDNDMHCCWMLEVSEHQNWCRSNHNNHKF